MLAKLKTQARSAPGIGGGWFVALVTTAALIGAVVHWGEIGTFMDLVRQAQPEWLALALACQLSTYASVASGWSAVLRRAGSPVPLRGLLRIALVKLFADQAVPTAGMGGNILLVDQLSRRGVDRPTAVAALLISMIGYYAAYAVLAVTALVLLWLHDQATPLLAGIVTLFLCVAFAIPALALWLRRRGSRPLPRRIEQIGALRSLLQTVAKAPKELLSDQTLLAKVTAFNSLIFLADAVTLMACLHALDQTVAFSTALIAFIMASIVVTLGPIPLGLGSFEATCTATLHLLGVSVEAAFAATLMLRVLTLWLPLIPGFALMRRTGRSRLPRHRRHDLPR